MAYGTPWSRRHQRFAAGAFHEGLRAWASDIISRKVSGVEITDLEANTARMGASRAAPRALRRTAIEKAIRAYAPTGIVVEVVTIRESRESHEARGVGAILYPPMSLPERSRTGVSGRPASRSDF